MKWLRHDHKGGTISFEARVIEIAGRLVDLGLPAKERFDRLDGEAVADLTAVTATFTYTVIDKIALGGVGKLAPFASPALL